MTKLHRRAALTLLSFPAWAQATPAGFATPEEGFAALAAAIARHDEARLLALLGEPARALLRSGDAVADRAARDAFTAAWQAGHAVEMPEPGRAVLAIGADAWPFPIPLVGQAGAWRFDARRGAQELVDRRIGRNELDTIATLQVIVAAQEEFARGPGRLPAPRSYARRFFSRPGQRDGLYWAATGDASQSPLGPLVAQAATGGLAAGETPLPFNGYLFRMLEGQGPAANGGAQSFIVNGRMIGGFGVLAWPARYGASGIQSFMVSHEGLVLQRNLGPGTGQYAAAITSFDPVPGWAPAAG